MVILNGRRVLLIIIAFYLASIFYNPQDISQHRKSSSLIGVPDRFYGDGYRYYQLSKTIVEKGRLNIYDSPSVLDVPVSLSLGFDDRVYITFGPGMSLLAVPFYLILGGPGLYLMSALLGIITCYFIYLTCRMYASEDAASHATLFLGLGSGIYTYSQVFYSEILSAALVSGSYYLLLRSFNLKDQRSLLISGLLAGLLPLTKPTLALLALVFLAYALSRGGRRSAMIFACGLLASVWIFGAYNMLCFGSPLRTGYASVLQSVGGKVAVLDFTSGAYWRNDPFKTIPLMVLFFIITQPIVALSIPGLLKVRDNIPALTLVSFALLLLAYGFYDTPLGGWTWGSRYLLSLTGLLAVPLARVYEGRMIRPGIIQVVFYSSILLAILGAHPLMWHFFTQLPWVQAVSYDPLLGVT
jgi:hypothetical protein